MNGLPFRPFPLVLAAPSGAGKTTLARLLVDGSDEFVFSVSATTRPARTGEVDGTHYHFVDRARFEGMASSGELLEWAEVHGALYGTPRAEVEAAEARGRHVVLDIDVQGARLIRSARPDALLVFVLPPSVEALRARLTGRGTEAPEQVARRFRTALEELRAVEEFDHVVVNDDLDGCLGEIRGIVRAERRRAARARDLGAKLDVMRAEISRILATEYAGTTQSNIP